MKKKRQKANTAGPAQVVIIQTRGATNGLGRLRNCTIMPAGRARAAITREPDSVTGELTMKVPTITVSKQTTLALFLAHGTESGYSEGAVTWL